MGYSIGGLLILVLDIYVIYLIVTGSGDTGKKLLWVILVLLLPLIGPILYFLIGRGA
jgi:Phospholipase_D-nuclease N-terminal